MNEARELAEAIARLEITLQKQSDVINRLLGGANHKYPYVAFQPPLTHGITVWLANNAEETVTIPSGTMAVRFKANGAFYISTRGRAQVPGAAITDAEARSQGLFYEPDGWFWTGGTLNSVSLIATAIRVVTIHLYIP